MIMMILTVIRNPILGVCSILLSYILIIRLAKFQMYCHKNSFFQIVFNSLLQNPHMGLNAKLHFRKTLVRRLAFF